MFDTREKKEIVCPDLSHLPATASGILDFGRDQRVWLFYGEMGVGKTTLIKEICNLLGVRENVSSPTYSLVNEYRGTSGRICHFDFYRLRKQEEAFDIGYEEYFYSGDLCLVEWPSKIEDLLPDHFLRIEIALNDKGERIIRLSKA